MKWGPHRTPLLPEAFSFADDTLINYFKDRK